MRLAHMVKLQPDPTQCDIEAVVEHLIGVYRCRPLHALQANQVVERHQLIPGSCFVVLDRTAAGDDACAMFLEITVAQPAMILTTGIDNDLHRLRRDLGNGGLDCLCTQITATGVDQDDAFVCDNESERGVVAEILRRTVAERPDQGENRIGDLLHLQAGGRICRRCNQQQEQCRAPSLAPEGRVASVHRVSPSIAALPLVVSTAWSRGAVLIPHPHDRPGRSRGRQSTLAHTVIVAHDGLPMRERGLRFG